MAVHRKKRTMNLSVKDGRVVPKADAMANPEGSTEVTVNTERRELAKLKEVIAKLIPALEETVAFRSEFVRKDFEDLKELLEK